LVVLAYGVTSTSITFFNKAVLSVYDFKYSMTLTLVQMVFSLLLSLFMKRIGLIRLADFDLKTARASLPLAFFFTGMVFSGLAPLHSVNVPMYGALRRITTFLVIIGERVFLTKKTPTDEILSVCFMVFGAMIAGLGDLTFSLEGYVLVFINCIFTALYLVYIPKTTAETKLNEFGLMFYNNLLSIPFVFILVIVIESQAVASYPLFSDLGFWTCFVMSSVQAFLLNYFIFLCSTINSPLTTSITGQLKNIFTTFIGLFLFKDVTMTRLLGSGLILSTIASVWYGVIKYDQKQQKDIEILRLKESRSTIV